MRELNIGERAWLAIAGMRQERAECPICAGKRTVTVILGSGSRVVVGCDFCRSGFDGSRGYVMEWVKEPRADQVTITEKRVEESDGERIVYYSSPLHFIGRDPVLFETETEALARAAEMADEQDRQERDNCAQRRSNSIKKAGWTAGFHLREAKRLREHAERHERWAREIKAEKDSTPPRVAAANQ